MPSFFRNDVVLVAYPFSDRSGVKVRPAVVVSGEHRSRDVFVVPLTSKTDQMIEGEFTLTDWKSGTGANTTGDGTPPRDSPGGWPGRPAEATAGGRSALSRSLKSAPVPD
jgi:hypothetical protein